MNKVAIYICVHVFVRTYIVNFLEYIPMIELLGHIAILCLNFFSSVQSLSHVQLLVTP